MTEQSSLLFRLDARIAEQSRATPDRIALVDEAGAVTYRALDRAATHLAQRLRARGVGAGSLVALCVPRSSNMVIGLLGILKAGSAYVPLDVDYPPERLAIMLADAEPAHVVTTRAKAPDLDWGPVAPVFVEDDRHATPKGGIAFDAPDDGLAYVMYTSGSTGRPKGVMNTHRGVLNTLDWARRALSLCADDVFLQKTSVSFDVSVLEILLPLMIGAKVIVARLGGEADAAYIQDTIQREAVTVVHFVPTMLRAFLAYADAERLVSLRLVVSSGEALSAKLARDCLATIPAELVNLYGPTEAAIEASYWWCRRGDDTVPIGHAIANTQLLILDEALRPVANGASGELCISGAGVARGYWRRPDETQARFVTLDPRGPRPSSRSYRTGDRARRRSDGAIELLGRLDRQVKVRGFRIELNEIERALESIGSVQSAAVLLRDPNTAHARIDAFIVRTETFGAPDEPDALTARLAQRLPPYMLPSRIVTLDALPRLPNGKLDRRALETAGHTTTGPPAGDEVRSGSAAGRLVDVVRAVLRIDEVGPDDALGDLGATSIDRLHIVARAHKAGIGLDLADLANHRTLGELGAAHPFRSDIETTTRSTRTTAEPATETASWPSHFPGGFRRGYSNEELEHVRLLAGGVSARMPSPVQSVFIAMTVAGRPDMATLTYDWRVDGAVDRARLQTAWTAVVQRHDALKCAFFVTPDREPVCVVYDHIDTEIGPLSPTSADEVVIDLRQPPLVRLYLETHPRHAELRMRVHHTVVDGWSVDLILTELWSLYHGRQLDDAPSYARYARWTSIAAIDPVLDRESRLLEGFVIPDAVPGRPDKSPCKWDHGPRSQTAVCLSPTESDQIRDWAHRAQTTPFSVVFLGWALALAKYFERADLLHRVTQHGRSGQVPDIERMVGPTLHPALVRIRWSPEDSITRLLTLIDAGMRAVQRHHFPRDWAVRWFFNDRKNPWVSRFIDENFHSHIIDDVDGGGTDRLGRRMRLTRVEYPDAEPLSAMLLYGPRLTLLTTHAAFYSADVVRRLLDDTKRASLQIAQTRRARMTDLSI